MNERVVVAQANNLQVASLMQPHTIKITKPQGDQSIVVDLNRDHSAKLDLSAVANEKLTLVHVDTKLVILFDNQGTVTADPFFDSSGKPIADLHVELSAGHGVNGEQFAQLFSITDDKSVLPDKIPPSGANFQNVAIDSLPDNGLPLALLGPEGLATQIGDVEDASSRHNIQTLSPVPTVTIPSPGGPATNVFEAGLGARGSEPAGSHAGQPSFPTTTKTGAISFCFCCATICGGFAHAGVCQDSLRNGVIDRKPSSQRFIPCHRQERKCRKDREMKFQTGIGSSL